mgnify:CR=1 FL=1
MTDWAQTVFMAEEIAKRLKSNTPTPPPSPATPLQLEPVAPVPVAKTFEQWLLSGPDDYDTIDETITSTQESTYRYEPSLLWAISFTNNAASGGANLLVRFTSGHGRTKQYKIPAGTSVSVNDLKGGYGSEFSVIADSGSAEMIALVSLKDRLQKS